MTVVHEGVPQLIAALSGSKLWGTPSTQVLPLRFRDADLDTMDDQGVADMVRSSLREGRGPLLMGPPGLGKTWAAAAAFNEKRADARSPVYFKPVRYFEERKRSFDGGDQLPPSMLDADLVFIDDWGKERMSDWVAEQTFQLVDTWYENDALVMGTTNMDFDGLKAHLSAPVFDRLREMVRSIPVCGVSRRGH